MPENKAFEVKEKKSLMIEGVRFEGVIEQQPVT